MIQSVMFFECPHFMGHEKNEQISICDVKRVSYFDCDALPFGAGSCYCMTSSQGSSSGLGGMR
jgi:hypothetical protein